MAPKASCIQLSEGRVGGAASGVVSREKKLRRDPWSQERRKNMAKAKKGAAAKSAEKEAASGRRELTAAAPF